MKITYHQKKKKVSDRVRNGSLSGIIKQYTNIIISIKVITKIKFHGDI